jgi:hypothetical protein
MKDDIDRDCSLRLRSGSNRWLSEASRYMTGNHLNGQGLCKRSLSRLGNSRVGPPLAAGIYLSHLIAPNDPTATPGALDQGTAVPAHWLGPVPGWPPPG